MGYPSFSAGDTLAASDMNAVGLWKVTSTSWTAVTSVSVNSCFSSNYDHYRIVGTVTSTSSNVIQFRVRSGNTDRNNSDYAWSRFVIAANNTTGSAGVYGDSYMIAGNYNSNSYSGFSIDVYNPNLARYTSIAGTSNEMAAAMFYSQFLGGISTSALAYDGFTLLFPSGNATGSLVVYGYRK